MSVFDPSSNAAIWCGIPRPGFRLDISTDKSDIYTYVKDESAHALDYSTNRSDIITYTQDEFARVQDDFTRV